MQIRRVAHNTYDVFGGVGFDQWTRVKKFHWGIKPIAGVALDRSNVKEIVAAIEAAPNGSVENV